MPRDKLLKKFKIKQISVVTLLVFQLDEISSKNHPVNKEAGFGALTQEVLT